MGRVIAHVIGRITPVIGVVLTHWTQTAPHAWKVTLVNHVRSYVQIRTEKFAVFMVSAAMTSPGQVNVRASKTKYSATGSWTPTEHAAIVSLGITRSSATSPARQMQKEISVAATGRADGGFLALDCARA